MQRTCAWAAEFSFVQHCGREKKKQMLGSALFYAHTIMPACMQCWGWEGGGGLKEHGLFENVLIRVSGVGFFSCRFPDLSSVWQRWILWKSFKVLCVDWWGEGVLCPKTIQIFFPGPWKVERRLVECTKQCTTSSLPLFQLFHCSRLTELLFLLTTFSGKHALLCLTEEGHVCLKTFSTQTIVRFCDRQTTNTCGWAVFLHVDFRFRDGDTDKTNTNTTSSAKWNLQLVNRGHSAVLYVCAGSQP